MAKDWNATARIRGDGSYTITEKNWRYTGRLSEPVEDVSDDSGDAMIRRMPPPRAYGAGKTSRPVPAEPEMDDEELFFSEEVTTPFGARRGGRGQEEREQPPVPPRQKPLSKRQERSERNKLAYLASQGVDPIPPPPPPPPPSLTRKVTPKPKRREIFLFDEAEPEPSPKPLKTGRERERERLRIQSVKKAGAKAKKTPPPPQRETTLVFIEDHSGSERGLQVRIGLRVLGTFWSEGLNLDAYHGKVGTVYQKVVMALMNVFDLETQSFTSGSVYAADCTWTLQKL